MREQHLDNEIRVMEVLPPSPHVVKYYGTMVGAIPPDALAMLKADLLDLLRTDPFGNRCCC